MSSVEYPNNALTRSIEQLREANASGASRGVASTATPQPSVRSASFGEVLAPPTPLTPEERAALDLAAVQAGIQDERLGNIEQPSGSYATMDEAFAAGAPVTPPDRMTAREFTAQRETKLSFSRPANPDVFPPMHSVRLPDFRNLWGISFITGEAWIDGMTFAMRPEDIAEFKQRVVETARAAITAKLNEALSLLSTPEGAEAADGGSAPSEGSSVQQQSPGSSPEPSV